MKKLNQKGFSHLEVILIVVVLALVGGSGFYYFKNQKKHDTKTTTTQTPVASANQPAAVTMKDYKNTEHGFSFQYPSNWKLTEDLHDSGRSDAANRTEGDVYVTSPNGTKVHFGPNFGGKGGECIDDQTGTETTRTCTTLTVYSAEKVPAVAGDGQVYFYQASLTAPTMQGGKTTYLVFLSNNSFFPAKPGSVLGATLTPYDEIHTDKSYLTVYVEGKDDVNNSSKAFFDTTEVKEATPILKSFRII